MCKILMWHYQYFAYLRKLVLRKGNLRWICPKWTFQFSSFLVVGEKSEIKLLFSCIYIFSFNCKYALFVEWVRHEKVWYDGITYNPQIMLFISSSFEEPIGSLSLWFFFSSIVNWSNYATSLVVDGFAVIQPFPCYFYWLNKYHAVSVCSWLAFYLNQTAKYWRV